MPINPLLSTAKAALAHAPSIHGLFWVAVSRSASRKHSSVAVMNNVRPMSSVLICATIMNPGLLARISAA